MKRFKHVVWDWNGTLLDDAWLWHEVTNGPFRKHGLPELTIDEYRKEIDFPIAEFYRRRGIDITPEEFKSLADDVHRAYEEQLKKCSLHKGATEVIAALSEDGKTHSILSALPQDILHVSVEHLGIKHHFTEICGTRDKLGEGKIGLGHEWMARAKMNPDDIILVGDTDHDVHVAQAIGIRCVVIEKGLHHPERLQKLGVPILESIEKLLEFQVD